MVHPREEKKGRDDKNLEVGDANLRGRDAARLYHHFWSMKLPSRAKPQTS